ncbi:metal ABC transporter ATP-binding protein [Actinospongicola halichondriae]|uniref:metal ABC transporter ATP-binding protein n=1 Tax=Actinospongicola halichondriae TaxID=3236844 RepID=UPI003D41B268
MTSVGIAPLAVRGLRVRYGSRVALEDVDFILDHGSTLAVIGPNGSGKSTLLSAIMGLVTPDAGSIDLGGRKSAIVLQSTAVDASLPITVAETVRMARYADRGLLARFGPDDRTAVQEALARVDVGDLVGRQLHDLSGGQRQRVLVAQGLAQEADLLLLDEPVTGLDPVSRDVILDVIDGERDAGRSVVMTTHNLDDARRCDRVLLLATRPIAFGTPDEVFQEDHLREAFGGRVLQLRDGGFLMDDPHHDH